MKQVGEEQQELASALNDAQWWTICCNILNFLFVMRRWSSICGAASGTRFDLAGGMAHGAGA
jgi:hypothetical protein